MPITFAPRRGAILLCDFGPDGTNPAAFPLHRGPIGLPPEIWKVRRVIVVSPDAMNHRHGTGPGLCTVVPCSATPPRTPADRDVFFAARSYRSFTRDVWAHCSSAMPVSHARLDRVIAGQGYRTDFLSPADMVRMEDGLRAALGL